jgi:hypothetical protein
VSTLPADEHDLAARLCAAITRETGLGWPPRLVETMATLLAVVERTQPANLSRRYAPADRLRWLRGETTSDNARPVRRELTDAHGLPVPVAAAMCHIALGTARFDDPGLAGSSSALCAILRPHPPISDRVAQRWAACLTRAAAGGPVPKTVTNRVRRRVDRHRRGDPLTDASPAIPDPDLVADPTAPELGRR